MVEVETRVEDELTTPLDGERKQVTVLFADVMGSMDMAEQTDPEEWRQIMQRFFSLLSDGVRRFEGTVDKFTGDGIMALFGAPIAHEDHAPRACFAALHIGELSPSTRGSFAAPRGSASRSGSGSTPARWSPARSVRTTSPSTPPSATRSAWRSGWRRWRSPARPTSPSTRQASPGLPGDEGPRRVRGQGGEPPDQGLRADRGGLGAIPARPLARAWASRFVGRAEEMEVLEGALQRANEGRGAVIGMVAEPGVGKSRLCHEFAERCRARGIEVYEAQAQAHGQAIPLLPMLQMLRAISGSRTATPSGSRARRSQGGCCCSIPTSPTTCRSSSTFWLAGPGTPRAADERRGAPAPARGVIRRLFRARAHRPGVILLEDLHWMDAGSEPFLEELVGAVEGTKTLAMMNFRPEYRPQWMSRSTASFRSAPRARVHLGAVVRPGRGGPLDRRPRGDDPRADRRQPVLIEEVVRELVEPAPWRASAAPTG